MGKRRDNVQLTSQITWGADPSTLPPRRALLSSNIADRIERYILTEQLIEGDRLPAGRELAELFGVSRTVIRDAISVLEQRGRLESRPGSGVYVADRGSQAVRDVLGQMLRQDAISFAELAEVRHLLEVHSAAVAASRATPDHLRAMSTSIKDMEDARDAAAFVEADVQFHEQLGHASSNRVLVAFLESLRPFLIQGMMAGTRLQGARDIAVTEHSDILNAVKNRDEESARQKMREHLERSSQEWRDAGVSTSDETVV